MIKSLSHISLSTLNLEKVVKFYVETLGLKIVHKFKEKNKNPYGLFIYAGNGTFLEFFKSKKIKRKRNSKNSFRHLCFSVKNIKKISIKLKKFDKYIKIRRGRTDNVLQFMTKDFENNIVEFHQYDKKSVIYKYISK